MRLWDTYLAEGAAGFADFLVYVAVALLLHYRDQLIGMDFQVRGVLHAATKLRSRCQVTCLLSRALRHWRCRCTAMASSWRGR